MLIIPYIMPIYVSEFDTQEQYANTILRLKNLYIYKLIIDILNPPEIILIPIAMLSLTLLRSSLERFISSIDSLPEDFVVLFMNVTFL